VSDPSQSSVGQSHGLVGVNENPGATAIATGVKDVVEGVYFPDENSPEWAGAPAIILRHFCGVAA